MNNSNTHLSIKIDKTKHVFTATSEKCDFCEEYSYVYCKGNMTDDKWNYACRLHLQNICCKKQHCFHCNKKSVIKDKPLICYNCADEIIENFIIMSDVCKFPLVSRDECKCIYCIKQT